jgi:iron complex outermembrane receptor protein
MRGDRFDGIRFDQSYHFALPRLGLSYAPRPDLTCYAAWAQSRREPAFRDLYDAEGAGSVPLFRDGKPLIRPEKVDDYELGAAWNRDAMSVAANLFWMEFRDELVFAGQFNTDLGYAIIGNAARSVHRGLELAGRAERAWGDWSAAIDANSTLSWNRFREYREVYGTSPGDTLRYDGNTIGFFPGLLVNSGVRLGWRSATLGIQARHVGRIFLDNTETRGSSIGPNTLVDLEATQRLSLGSIGRAELSVRVFNLLDREYEASGYMDFDSAGNLVPHFIPAAKRTVLGQIRVEFQ